MAVATVGPCEPWPHEPCCDFEAMGVDGELMVAVATELLWRLSGRRYGLCTLVVRPCARRCFSAAEAQLAASWAPQWTPPGGFSAAPVVPWHTPWPACGCGGVCDCTTASWVQLPRPVHEVLEVRLDGQVLTEGVDWRLGRRGRLYRLGGERWPACQDLSLPDDAPGAFAVKLRRGRPVPVSGAKAVGELACELAKACVNDSSCRLPKRVTQITRQGVSMTLLDPMEFLDDGRTGLYNVDLFLQAVNPHGLARSGRVYRADRVS